MTTTTTTRTATLLLIDAQKDFHPGGSLAIPTANDDAARIANLIKSHGTNITRVIATMDSHLKLHIAHPGFWVDGETGTNHPNIFTIISHQDVVDGKWKARKDILITTDDLLLDPTVFEGGDDLFVISNDSGSGSAGKKILDLQKYALEYTKRLESKSKFQLCIWPEHCLIGSPGHALVDDIREALNEWSETTGRSVEFVFKGENILTESYSAMEAEVPVTKDTTFNTKLLESILAHNSDRLLVCGQAMSHCVNFTLRNIVQHWSSSSTVSSQKDLSSIVLLTDCASSVPGFEAAGDEFQADMKALGVQLLTSNEVFSS